jgi:hypothetical protein
MNGSPSPTGKQDADDGLGILDATIIDHGENVISMKSENFHVLFFGSVHLSGHGLQTARRKDVHCRVGHARSGQKDVEEIPGVGFETGLLTEFSLRRRERFLTGHVSHTRWNLDHDPIDTWSIVPKENDPIRIVDGHDGHRAGRAHDVARELFAIRTEEATNGDFPDVSLVYGVVPEMPEATVAHA